MSEPDEECPHGLGEPAWCTMCNGRDRRERKEEQLRKEMSAGRVPFWLFAKRPSELRAGRWDAGANPEFDPRVLGKHGLIDEFGPGHTSTLEGRRRNGR